MAIQHLSHSALDDYRKCPWGFKLKRIDKVEQAKLLAGPAGTAFHTMTEEYDNGIIQRADWRPKYRDYLDATIELGGVFDLTVIRDEDRRWWYDTGERMFNQYTVWRQNTGWKVKGVEIEFNVQLPGLQLPLVGYVDRVFEMSNGRLVVVDIKTGYRVPAKTDQLRTYRAALMAGGMDADGVSFYGARDGNSTGIEYPDDTPETLALEIQPIERAILAEEFPPKPSAKNCNGCYVKEHCEFSKATKVDD